MPNWSTQTTTLIGVGQVVTLAAGDLDAPYSTRAVAVGRDGGMPEKVTIYNYDANDAPVYAAAHDVNGEYLPLTDGDTGQAVTVPSMTAVCFSFSGIFLRVEYASYANGNLFIVR